MGPDPSESRFHEGVEVPCGRAIKQTDGSSLRYNEYIVYDTGQVLLRYLLRVRFAFR